VVRLARVAMAQARNMITSVAARPMLRDHGLFGAAVARLHAH
jgi:hypothetical protein